MIPPDLHNQALAEIEQLEIELASAWRTIEELEGKLSQRSKKPRPMLPLAPPEFTALVKDRRLPWMRNGALAVVAALYNAPRPMTCKELSSEIGNQSSAGVRACLQDARKAPTTDAIVSNKGQPHTYQLADHMRRLINGALSRPALAS